jgi:replicative DNA helicase
MQSSEIQLNQLLARNFLLDFMETLDRRANSDYPYYGSSISFRDLQEITGGLDAGIVLIAGRPSMGKTIFALNVIIESVFNEKKKVCIFGPESNGLTTIQKILAALSGTDLLKIRTGRLNEEEWNRIISCVSMISDSNLYISDNSCTIDSIESISKQIKPQLILVDSLQIIENHNPKTTRYRNLNEITQRLNRLAIELNMPVLLTSQVHRRIELRADKRPCLSDFYETEMMVNSADKVLFLYRDEVYNENTATRNIMEVICAKNRTGPIGKIRLRYDFHCCALYDFSRNNTKEGAHAG